MFPRDAATGARRAASMYDDYYDYDYGHGLEAVRQAAAAIPLPPAYGTKAKVDIGYKFSYETLFKTRYSRCKFYIHKSPISLEFRLFYQNSATQLFF